MLPYESTNHVLRVLGLHTTFYMGKIENEVVKFDKQLQLNAVCEQLHVCELGAVKT